MPIHDEDEITEFMGFTPPIRACTVCLWSIVTTHADLACTNPHITGAIGKTTHCREARALSGPCGPEARFQKMKGE